MNARTLYPLTKSCFKKGEKPDVANLSWCSPWGSTLKRSEPDIELVQLATDRKEHPWCGRGTGGNPVGTAQTAVTNKKRKRKTSQSEAKSDKIEVSKNYFFASRRKGGFSHEEKRETRKERREKMKQVQLGWELVRLKKMGKTGKKIEELTGVCQNRASEIWTAYQREGDISLERKRHGRKASDVL